jgi:dTDP-4-amino-4,6-dideoxygalactose transaminase
MIDHYIVFAKPDIQQAEIDEVADTMRSGWLGQGAKVARFERMFAEYTGAKYAVSTSSCTAAMHLSLLTARIGKGDEVITTPMTFASTANAIIHAGARPVFVDCDRDTGLIDPAQIQYSMTENTKAILPVHLYGRPCNMEAIWKAVHRKDIVVIEDAAHAIEAEYHGEHVGTLGHLTCFSFYVTKNVITGTGGMVTTDNPVYAQKIRELSDHGMTANAYKRYSDDGYKHYEVVCPGYEYNMTDMQAAIGIHQLERVDANLARRNEIWHRYNDAFEYLPIGLPPQNEPGITHARHLYTLLIDQEDCGISRDEFIREMHGMRIGTGVHFIGLHLQPYYRYHQGLTPDDFPNATYISERTVSIPLSPALTDDEVDYIIDTVREIIGRKHGG